jgi:hypothetical protein
LFTTSARARSWKTGCSNSRSPATTFGAASERRRARRCIQSFAECENARHFVLRSVLARLARLPPPDASKDEQIILPRPIDFLSFTKSYSAECLAFYAPPWRLIFAENAWR